MKPPKHYYESCGPGSGACLHYHRTLDGAVWCLRKRRLACRKRGVGCDAVVIEVDQIRRVIPEYEYDEDAAAAYKAAMDEDAYDEGAD